MSSQWSIVGEQGLWLLGFLGSLLKARNFYLALLLFTVC